MSLRKGDFLITIDKMDKFICCFTRKGSALSINSSEIPTRETSAVGVKVMGVRNDDEIVQAIPFKRSCRFNVILSNGKKKQFDSSDILHGHRSLKGTKIVSKADIVAVEILREQ